MNFISLCILWLCAPTSLTTTSFDLQWKGIPIVLGQKTIIGLDTFCINTLKFYIEIPTSPKHQEHFLIDFNDTSSVQITTQKPIKFFKLGVDSALQKKGICDEPALNPQKGMYWTWQNGYITLKIEGTFNGKKLLFHLGGFQSYNANGKIVFMNHQSTLPIQLNEFIATLPLNQDLKVMSPHPNNEKWMNAWSQCFHEN
jgi:hypothetical protein